MSDPALLSPSVPARSGWIWINGLALDAVAVAVAWLLVFEKMTGARLTLVNAGALAAAVWLVYMADRLVDGWSGAGTEWRHQFAVRYARWLLPLMALVAAGTTWWVLHQMRWITVKAGLWIAVAVALYYLVIAASRWKAVSPALLIGVSMVMILGLVQGEDHGSPGVQLWRAIAAGTLITVLYFGMRHHYDPPPWTLVKKGMGGYLFALGVAAGPFSHLQDWDGLLRGAPVVLFAGVCALNSLGIRLWENRNASDSESLLLRRLYPWLLAAVGIGAVTQAWTAVEWTRPVLAGVAACTAGLGVLHILRNRWPTAVYSLAADGLMVVVAVVVRWVGMRGLP